MSEQRERLQLGYKEPAPTRERLVGRCYKGLGDGKIVSRTYYEKLEFWGFTCAEAERLDEGEIRNLFPEEIRTDKLEPTSKGRFGPSLAIEDFLKDASSVLGGADPPYESPFGLWSDLGADISADDIALARAEMWANFPRPDLP